MGTPPFYVVLFGPVKMVLLFALPFRAGKHTIKLLAVMSYNFCKGSVHEIANYDTMTCEKGKWNWPI
jgi:hypothetical protein